MPYIVQIINETTVPIRYTYEWNGFKYERPLNPAQQAEDFATLKFDPPHEVPPSFSSEPKRGLSVTFLKQGDDGPFVGVRFHRSEFWLDYPVDGDVLRYEKAMERDRGAPAVGQYCILRVKEQRIGQETSYEFKAYQYENEGSKIVYITGKIVAAAFVAVGVLLLGAIL